MKTLVLGLSLLLLTIGVVPALAQTTTQSPATTESPATSPGAIAPDVKAPDVNPNDPAVAASPRTDTDRNFSLFGLSAPAAIILGLLLAATVAFWAMRRNRATTPIDHTNRRL